MDFSVDEFLAEIKISDELRKDIESDYAYLRAKLGFRLANDTLGKYILSNRYGSLVNFKLAIAFKKWCNNKMEDYYSASKPASSESVAHCYIGNTEVL